MDRKGRAPRLDRVKHDVDVFEHVAGGLGWFDERHDEGARGVEVDSRHTEQWLAGSIVTAVHVEVFDLESDKPRRR